MATAARRATAGPDTRASAIALRVLSILMGVFFLFLAIDKIAWLTDDSILSTNFDEWSATASPSVRWYIETIAKPGTPLFSRLVPLAEFAAGVALIAGFWTRLAAALALLMVLNFHFAMGSFQTIGFLRDGAGLPVVGSLLALAIAGGRLPLSVSRQ